MQVKYLYKEQDVTTDIMFKIEHIVSIIAEKEKISFEQAYLDFLKSNTYKALQKTSSLMWAESAEFIVDEYYRE
ncbi:MAG: hypothetical protein LBU89_04675 [Fibromonadaceae bacterium]|jgi:hypothetical protein|nr:hypothetical protein [Fibromonadaceae bacterium]